MPVIDGAYMTILALISAVSAAAYFFILTQPQSVPRAIVKTCPLAAMTLISFTSGLPALLTAGLALSAIGDLALGFDDNGDRPFLVGIAAFMLAQLVYAILFFMHPEEMSLLPFIANVIIAMGMVAAGIMTQAVFWPTAGAMRIPVAIYTAIIILMGLSAVFFAKLTVVIGSLSFMASDTLVGLRRFVFPADSPHNGWTNRLLWVLYIAAQSLILYGFLDKAV